MDPDLEAEKVPEVIDPSTRYGLGEPFEDDFKVTETTLASYQTKLGTPDNLSNRSAAKAPKTRKGNDRLVDENFSLKENKPMWPFVVASLLVLFGAAYAFVWMPIISNGGVKYPNEMDMSIGRPEQVTAEVNVKPAVQEKLDLPIATPATKIAVKTETVNEVLPDSRIETAVVQAAIQTPSAVEGSDDSLLKAKAEIGTKAYLTSEAVVIEPVPEPTFLKIPALIASVKIDTPVPTQQVSEPVIKTAEKVETVAKSNSISDTDENAIKQPSRPQLQLASFKQAPEQAVEVPVLETSVRRYIVRPTEVPETSTELASVEPEPIQRPARAATVRQVKFVAPEKVSVARVAVTKPVRKKRPKKVVNNANTRLLESVAVKLMEQDLDKLLPN